MKKRITKSGKEVLIMPEDQNQKGDNMKNNNEIEINKDKYNNNFINEKENIFIKKRKKNNDNNLLLSFLDIEKE